MAVKQTADESAANMDEFEEIMSEEELNVGYDNGIRSVTTDITAR